MSRAELIYPLKKDLERELALISNDPNNSEILTRYYKVRSSKVALATLVIDFIRLNEMSRILGKKFEDAKTQDIENLIFIINQKHHHPNTQNKYRKVLKRFFQWLRGCSRGEYPPEVKWIELNKVPLVAVKPEDLLTFEECVKIGESAFNLRDKALIFCKLDAGCRIGEILTVRLDEVRFNDAGAILNSDGKTGEGPLILTWSAKTLKLWMDQHPFRNIKDAPLWCAFDRDHPVQLSYAGAVRAFHKSVKRAGYVNRRVWFHLLKHVSSTKDAELGLPESYRKFKHHWSQDSKMSRVYEHLSQSVIPKIQNKTWELMSGSQVKADIVEGSSPPLIKKCKHCECDNQHDSLFCNKCGYPMDDNKGDRAAIASAMNEKDQSSEEIERLTAELAKSPQALVALLKAFDTLKDAFGEKY